jgi:hypothetical protein
LIVYRFGWLIWEYEDLGLTERGRMKSNSHAMPALAVFLLLTACSELSSSDVLNSRVSDRMAPAQPCNKTVSVEYLPTGARISMPDSTLFTLGRPDLSPCGQYAMASAVQAMLAPRIVQVVIEPGGDIEAPYNGLAQQRAETLKRTFTNVGFVPFQPPPLVQSTPGPQIGVWGVVLTVPGRT